MLETFQLSNDAFYYLKDNEPPILDDALEEIDAIDAMFPKGFSIYNFKPLGNTGYMEVTIGPKVKAKTIQAPPEPTTFKRVYNSNELIADETDKYYDSDEVYNIVKGARFELIWLNEAKSEARLYIHNLITGQRKLFGEFPITCTADGAKYIQRTNANKTFTRIYLKSFTKVHN